MKYQHLRLLLTSFIIASCTFGGSLALAPVAHFAARQLPVAEAVTDFADGPSVAAANLGTRYVNCSWGGWCRAGFSMLVSNRVWVVASHEYCPPNQGCSYWAEGRWTPGNGTCGSSQCDVTEWFQAVAWYDHIYALSASDLNGNAWWTYAGAQTVPTLAAAQRPNGEIEWCHDCIAP